MTNWHFHLQTLKWNVISMNIDWIQTWWYQKWHEIFGNEYLMVPKMTWKIWKWILTWWVNQFHQNWLKCLKRKSKLSRVKVFHLVVELKDIQNQPWIGDTTWIESQGTDHESIFVRRVRIVPKMKPLVPYNLLTSMKAFKENGLVKRSMQLDLHCRNMKRMLFLPHPNTFPVSTARKNNFFSSKHE